MRAPALDWNDVRYFLAAVRAGSIAGGARTIGVRHTTVGRRLSVLEAALGARLVVRTPEGLKLTTSGERAAALGSEMEKLFASFTQAARGQKAGELVRVATASGFAKLLAPGLADVRAKHPSILVEVLTSNRHVDLLRGEAEIALRVGPTSQTELISKKVGEVGWSVYAAKSYLARRPVRGLRGGLDGHDVLGYDATLSTVPGALWLAEHGARANIVARFGDLMEMVDAAVTGVGLTVLPCLLGDAEPRLARVTNDVLASRSVNVVYRKDALRSDAVRTVARMLGEIAKREAAMLYGMPVKRRTIS